MKFKYIDEAVAFQTICLLQEILILNYKDFMFLNISPASQDINKPHLIK